MKAYRLKEKSGILSSPAFLGASAEELRVLAFLALSEAAVTEKEIAAALSCEAEDLRDVLSFWRGAGAIEIADGKAMPEKPKKKKYIESADALTDYSDSEAATIIERGDLASFVEECQEIYGKVLSPADIHVILGLHDQLSLEPEYICLLIAFCNESGVKKPFRYIEKVALSLYDREIVSVKDLESYIEKKHLYETREGKIRKLYGMGERRFTAKEEEAVMRWFDEFGFDDSVIEYAYEITVDATQKPSVRYADTILTNWYRAGCRNIYAVKELVEKQKEERKNAKSKKTEQKTSAEKESMRSFDVDDFFEHALNRSYGDKNKKE